MSKFKLSCALVQIRIPICERKNAEPLVEIGFCNEPITKLRGSATTRVCSIFSRVLQLIRLLEFESAVLNHGVQRHARGEGGWGQFRGHALLSAGRPWRIGLGRGMAPPP
jgi:hypothetical protein